MFAAAKLLLLDWWQRQQSKANVVECSLTQGCVLPDGSKVRATSINTHEPFDIVVENVPKNTGAVSISFSMKNMDMGFNRYNLTQQSPQSWQAAQIRLPFCIEAAMITLPTLPLANRLFRRHLVQSSHRAKVV